jgi:hypothetical protein
LKKFKKILTVLICIAEIATVGRADILQSFAEEIYTAADGNQVSEEDLNDGVIEYRELGSLIHRNNTSVQKARDSIQRTEESYKEIKEQLQWERLGTLNEKNEAEKDNDIDTYSTDTANEKIYMNAISSFTKIIKNLDKSGSGNDSWKQLEKQLTRAAQELMISYHSLTAEEETLTELCSLYEQQYAEKTAEARAGTATELDVRNAENMLSSAKNSSGSVSDGKSKVYRNLCIILGLDENSIYEIGEIPELGAEEISAINLEEDAKTAISNNSTILTTRHTSVKSTAGVQNKALLENGQDSELEVKMSELYGKIEDAQLSCNTASTGMEAAEKAFNSAEVKYSAGLSGKSEYLQSEQTYLQKKSAWKASELNLFQAYETYEWAVKGITELE